jgi:hypothetical protein
MAVTLENLGIREAYHATNAKAALSILQTQELRAGTGGLFGAGRYFADTIKIAQYKSIHGKGPDAAIILAQVNFGMAWVLQGPRPDMTGGICTRAGANSVKGRSCASADWEYVVYRSQGF